MIDLDLPLLCQKQSCRSVRRGKCQVLFRLHHPFKQAYCEEEEGKKKFFTCMHILNLRISKTKGNRSFHAFFIRYRARVLYMKFKIHTTF